MTPRPIALLVAIACAFASAVAAEAATEASASAPKPYIAVVNGQRVTVEEFDRAMVVAMRNKFYHRTPPEGQLDAVRVEVADSLIDRALLVAEARKRNLAIDEEAIQRVLDGYEARYGKSPNWKEMRERALPDIRRELENQQRLARLEAEVRDVPAPNEKETRAFYEANKGLFTEPERVRVSVILLKVDPAAPKADRDRAREEGRTIRERLAKGADFAELAKIHSSDSSASKGGDLGYLHKGMLSEALHEQVDAMKAGDITPALDVLEGVAVFKLTDRAAPRVREFADVRSRASELLRREHSDRAWKQFAAGLRAAAIIEREPGRFPAAAPAAADQQGSREKETTWARAQTPRTP